MLKTSQQRSDRATAEERTVGPSPSLSHICTLPPPGTNVFSPHLLIPRILPSCSGASKPSPALASAVPMLVSPARRCYHDTSKLPEEGPPATTLEMPWQPLSGFFYHDCGLLPC